MSEETRFSFGALRSPIDNRDFLASTIYSRDLNLPAIVNHIKDLQPIRDQGRQGTCAAQSAACIKEWQEFHDVDFDQYMSPQFIYNNRENQNSEGMYGRDVMRILSKIGCCEETRYPYNTIEPNDNIDSALFSIANHYKVSGYARVNTLDDLKRALYRNGPCYIALPCYNWGPTFWRPKDSSDNSLGGHAVTIVGYNDIYEKLILRNSWGEDWGNNGYTDFPYSDFGIQWEIWTTIDEESNKPDDPPPPVPNPEPVPSCKCTIL